MPPGSGPGLLRVAGPEVAEQELRLLGHPQHQEVPWQPEEGAVPAGGGAGPPLSPGAPGESQVGVLLSSNARLSCVLFQMKIRSSQTLCAEKIP